MNSERISLKTGNLLARLLVVMCLVLLSACAKAVPVSSEEPAMRTEETGFEEEKKTEENAVKELKMKIDDRELSVVWEENESVSALKEKISEKETTVSMSMYGGFEQVGPLGFTLPETDEEITTAAGDIVLYSGNQIVVFYGSNSWAYTRLGKIEGMSLEELKGLLGNGDVKLTLYIEP